jgi:histidyl-tRNA synthetase
MEYTIPKGLFDILPFQTDPENAWKISGKWQFLESLIRETCALYGFKEIRTPIFERTELFIRGVGETSDVVSKEMYTFEDKAGRSMTLRPEGTAPVMRAILENRLHQNSSSIKLFYIAPMFRYDRPQAGRYRQHHQFGVEAIGCDKPEQDVEVIELLLEVYRRLGLKNLQLYINSVGDIDTRARFGESLKSFLSSHFDSLSKDSQIRFHKNPLRILDSKAPEDQDLIRNAPSILNFLSQESKAHFDKVLDLLSKVGISYQVNPLLVRGLDYYNKTVFEITAGSLGAQNSIGGGGRYDGLSTAFGGPNLPSIGFGTGLERILQTMLKQEISFPEKTSCDIYLLPLGETAKTYCFQLASSLRKQGISAECDFSSKKIQQGLQNASKAEARFCLILGEEELISQNAVLKNLQTREQIPLKLENCLDTLSKSIGIKTAHTLN